MFGQRVTVDREPDPVSALFVQLGVHAVVCLARCAAQALLSRHRTPATPLRVSEEKSC